MKNTDFDNDNEPLTFDPLSLATRRIMEKLFKQFDDPHADARDDKGHGEAEGDETKRAKFSIR